MRAGGVCVCVLCASGRVQCTESLRRTSTTGTTLTGRGRAGGGVWAVSGEVAELLAQVEDEGEVGIDGERGLLRVRVAVSGHVMESSGGVDASSSGVVQRCSWEGEGTGSFVCVRHV